MNAHLILVLHIVVLGYWLGSELVINSTYRYVSYAKDMPFAERKRLMQHVMNVDQHVRYALILQFLLGFMLATQRGYLPLAQSAWWIFLLTGIVWLIAIEFVHRQQHTQNAALLAKADRVLRYLLMPVLLVIAWLALSNKIAMPNWLGIKLICFAATMASGVGIRFALIRFFETWKEIEEQGSTESREQQIRTIYVKATSILVLLWIFILVIVWLSIWKPTL